MWISAGNLFYSNTQKNSRFAENFLRKTLDNPAKFGEIRYDVSTSTISQTKKMKMFNVVVLDFGSEIVEHAVVAFTAMQASDLVQSIFPFVDILECFEV